MNVSPVYHGAPAESRTPVEDRTYAALTALGIPFDRVDHDPAEDMADCGHLQESAADAPEPVGFLPAGHAGGQALCD